MDSKLETPSMSTRPSITISELVTEAHSTSREKGFWDPPKSVGEDIALMHSELSEALECYRSGDAPSAVYTCGGGGKLEGVPVELADVIIRIADFCGYHKIDLNRAIEEKLAYNRTRPHRHGGKAL